MKEEIRVLKNHIMFIDQCIVRLTVLKEVGIVNRDKRTKSIISDEVDEYLLDEIKSFPTNYDDDNNTVYGITETVDEYNLIGVIESLIMYYAVKKKEALEKIFLLS